VIPWRASNASWLRVTAVYNLTKAGLIQLTRSMALDCRRITFRSTQFAPVRLTEVSSPGAIRNSTARARRADRPPERLKKSPAWWRFWFQGRRVVIDTRWMDGGYIVH
jgi:NAD(P)-dependent dehydrogenase (short-subunit alcohol dehydrogenase family)